MTTRLRWWAQIPLCFGVYMSYDTLRNKFGSVKVPYSSALANAERAIRVERALGLYHEGAVQRFALSHRWITFLANDAYGLLHLLVPIAVLVVLYRRSPELYRWARNGLGATLGLALLGFSVFPMAPPRLLPQHFGFVDTLARFGFFGWHGTAPSAALTNQYAAMPSVHFAWSVWCAVALFALSRRRLVRVLAVLYPALMLGTIVVTGNHLFIDAVAGAAAVAGGFAACAVLARAGRVVVPAPEPAPVVLGAASAA